MQAYLLYTICKSIAIATCLLYEIYKIYASVSHHKKRCADLFSKQIQVCENNYFTTKILKIKNPKTIEKIYCAGCMCQVHERTKKTQRAAKIAGKWQVNIKIFMQNVKNIIKICMNFVIVQLIEIIFTAFALYLRPVICRNKSEYVKVTHKQFNGITYLMEEVIANVSKAYQEFN